MMLLKFGCLDITIEKVIVNSIQLLILDYEIFSTRITRKKLVEKSSLYSTILLYDTSTEPIYDYCTLSLIHFHRKNLLFVVPIT